MSKLSSMLQGNKHVLIFSLLSPFKTNPFGKLFRTIKIIKDRTHATRYIPALAHTDKHSVFFFQKQRELFFFYVPEEFIIGLTKCTLGL